MASALAAGVALVFFSADQAAAALSLLVAVITVFIAFVFAPSDVLRRIGLSTPTREPADADHAARPAQGSGLTRPLAGVRERLDSELLARRERRNADQWPRLLARVQRDYSQRLAQLLHRMPHIALGLDAAPGAVAQAFDRYVQGERSREPYPRGTTIRTVFSEAGDWNDGQLLILGEPGAGKTTLLYELGLALAAEEDVPGFRIPVYVPLSSWTAAQETTRLRQAFGGTSQADRFLAYLAEKVSDLYTVPLATARSWLHSGDLLLLLDGLDEIPNVDDRVECLRVLNQLIPELDTPVVVCSRRVDYESLGIQASLREAVVIRELQESELMRAVRAAGSSLSGVRTVLQEDEGLREMCRSPLFLSMVVVAYADQKASKIRSGGTSAERRAKLLDDYVDHQLLGADPADPSVTAAQREAASRNRAWLAWLAQRMITSNQPLCLIERMGPNWLRAPFRLAAVIPALIVFYLGRTFISTAAGAELGVTVFAGAAITFPPMDRLSWSWYEATSGSTVVLAAVLGLVVGEVLGIPHLAAVPTMTLWPVHWTVPTLVGAALLGLIFGCPVIAAVLGFRAAPILTKATPYEGLRRSAIVGLLIAVIAAVGGSLLFLLIVKVAGTAEIVTTRLPVAITGSRHYDVAFSFVLPFALALGLICGLGAALGHVWLRFCLWVSQRGPLRYVAWLEQMVAKRLLFRSGSGYGFIHRFLLEELAGRRIDEPSAPSVPAS